MWGGERMVKVFVIGGVVVVVVDGGDGRFCWGERDEREVVVRVAGNIVIGLWGGVGVDSLDHKTSWGGFGNRASPKG